MSPWLPVLAAEAAAGAMDDVEVLDDEAASSAREGEGEGLVGDGPAVTLGDEERDDVLAFTAASTSFSGVTGESTVLGDWWAPWTATATAAAGLVLSFFEDFFFFFVFFLSFFFSLADGEGD